MMFTLAIISLMILFVYVLDALSGNVPPPRNPLAKRIQLSILIGFAIQSAVVTAFPGYLIVFLLIDGTLKAGGDINDWRILIANMLLYGGLSFLILTESESRKRAKKSLNK